MKNTVFSLATLFLILFSLPSYAQDDNIPKNEGYNSAIGLRLGYPASLSFKTFVNDNSALEAYIGLRNWGFGKFINLSGAYQIHKPVEGVDQLKWYYGAGASVYFWTYDNIFLNDGFSSTSFGLQGYLGLDYAFKDAPINLTLDWIPSFFIGGSLNIDSFSAGYGSLGVRYILGR